MTSELKKSIISANNGQQIRTFEEDGIHINRSPIPLYGYYAVSNVAANTNYYWRLDDYGFDVLPHTIFGYKSTGVANADDFFVEVLLEVSGTPIWAFNLKNAKNIIGNAWFWEFPRNAPIAHQLVGQIRSAVALDKVSIFFSKCYLDPPIPPSN